MVFKSEAILNELSHTLVNDKSLQQDIWKKLNANVLFNIKNSKGDTIRWRLIGKKDTPVKLEQIQNSDAGENENDVEISLSDTNLVKIAHKKVSSQRLFMSGKLKIKGNVMKVSFIEPMLQSQAKLKAKL